MRHVYLAGLLLGVPAAQSAYAQSDEQAPTAEIALSNDTIQLRYLSDGDIVKMSRAQFSGGFFLSEQRDIVLSAGLLFPADLNFGPVSMTFGPRVYAALLEDENSDVMTLTLGTQVRFDIDRRRGLALVGEAFYGPDILTFGAADSLTDLSARVELRVSPQLTAFGGMRWFEFDLAEGEGERTLQEELFAGVGFRF